MNNDLMLVPRELVIKMWDHFSFTDPSGETTGKLKELLAAPAAQAVSSELESELPAGLSWDQAPANAVALIGGKIDEQHPERKLFVWVPALDQQATGVLAAPFDHRPAGSPQSAALGSPYSQWVVLAKRPTAECAICRDLGDQCLECEEAEFVAWADRHFASVDYRKTDSGVYIQDWMCHAFAAWQARGALIRKPATP